MKKLNSKLSYWRLFLRDRIGNFICNMIYLFCFRDRKRRRNEAKAGWFVFGNVFNYWANIRRVRRNLKREPEKFQDFLSIVCIVKNEANCIAEWIDFHLAVGVNKIYLYDNDSTDNIREVVAPYVAAGRVEYIPRPGRMQQSLAYNDCILRHRADTKYLAIIDADEFLMPTGGKTIREILNAAPDDVAQIRLFWRNFGSSGFDSRPKNVLEHYLRRSEKSLSFYPNYKMIVKPWRVYYAGIHRSLAFGTIADARQDELAVYHYWCKSRQDFAERWSKGDACYRHLSVRSKPDWNVFADRDQNEVFDDTAIKVLKKYK